MNPVGLNDLINLLLSISVWSVLKIFVCFAFFIYVMFAVVVVKQVNLMTETLGGQLELPLKMIAAIHLAGAISLLVLVIFIL